MKITADGGALCGFRQGTYIVAINLLEAIQKYDRLNFYTFYTFCDMKRLQSERVTFKQIQRHGYMKVGISLQEVKNLPDVFLGLNQSFPFITQAREIGFCHGLSYHFYPKLYGKLYKRLSSQLTTMMKNSDAIVVSSLKVKKEIKEIFPQNKIPIHVLPFGVPFDMEKKLSAKRQKYFLHVGRNKLVKRVDFIIKIFNKLKNDSKYKDFKLILVGDYLEYKNEANIVVHEDISRENLKKLYAQATCYLTASYYESFNLPVLEALSQGCPVIGMASAVVDELAPFVTTTTTETEFFFKVKKAAEGKIQYNNLKDISKEFTWKKYLTALETIYETLSSRPYQK